MFNLGFMAPNAEIAGAVDTASALPAGPERTAALADVCTAVDRDAQMIPLVTRPSTVAYRTDAASVGLYATEGYGNALRLIADFRKRAV